MSGRWLLYGAYGFTGRLVAREAVERGHRPVLAGRDGPKTAALAGELGLEHRVVALDEEEALREALRGVDAVVHTAGPFSGTWRPMAEACLDAGAHYLDVTGEVAVFESLHALDGRAAAAGVALLPGVGMDVVPTDCLAARLAERLPDATHLELALHATGGPSRGTARTQVEALGESGKERRDGRIVDVPMGSVRARIPFNDRERPALAIPWGDVSTAYHSTGIPNVRVDMTFPRRVLGAARLLPYLRPVLGMGPVQRALRWWVDRTVEGPGPERREEAGTRIRGRAWRGGDEGSWAEGAAAPDRDGAGGTGRDGPVAAELTAPNGYAFTAASAVAAVEALLALDGPRGFLTPARAFGPEFVDALPGIRWIAGGPGG